MSKKGRCHLCGRNGKLSKEHLPPEAVGNNVTTIRADIRQALSSYPERLPDGPAVAGGFWKYSLCEGHDGCNEFLGRTYIPAFREWCCANIDVIRSAGGRPTLINLLRLKPLRVLKQIVGMFASVHDENFSDTHPYLTEFVLNPLRRGLPPDYRFWLGYNTTGVYEGGYLRYSAQQRKVNAVSRVDSTFSEITFPPFVYVMTVNNPPPDYRLVDISWFAQLDFDQSVEASVRLPMLSSTSPLPGDYRDAATIRSDALIPDARKQEIASAFNLEWLLNRLDATLGLRRS